MTSDTAVAAEKPMPRVSRLPVRGRLTITFVALLLTGCTTMLAIVYAFMRYVPTYRFGSLSGTKAPATTLSVSGGPVDNLVPSSVQAVTGSPLSIGSQAGVLSTLLWVSLSALFVILMVGAGASWVVAGRVLRPLRRINHAAHLAGSGSLTHRIGLSGPRDEITELSQTFDVMLERLNTSFQARQRFAANASHELQTPLSATKTILEVAAADPSSVDIVWLLERLRVNNSRSIETVEALLDLAHTDSRDIDRQEVDLAALVTQAVHDAESHIHARDLTILLDLHDGHLLGDPVLLQQLAANLVRNAVHHNVQHGFISVRLRCDTADGSLQLAISNSGPHVTDEALAVLTEPFFRAAGRVVDAANPHRGHGLGLALVDGIVDAHDGKLSFEAREGGGLTVRVFLPRPDVANVPEDPTYFDLKSPALP